MAVFHRNHVRNDRFSIFWIEKNHFQTKKLKFIKRAKKNELFIRGLVHGFCPKMEIYFTAVFHRNHVRNDRFSIFWIEKNHFQTKKLKFIKRAKKNEHFIRGLVHGFCPKIELSLNPFFFTEIKPEKIVFGYFKTKKLKF